MCWNHLLKIARRLIFAHERFPLCGDLNIEVRPPELVARAGPWRGLGLLVAAGARAKYLKLSRKIFFEINMLHFANSAPYIA